MVGEGVASLLKGKRGLGGIFSISEAFLAASGAFLDLHSSLFILEGTGCKSGSYSGKKGLGKGKDHPTPSPFKDTCHSPPPPQDLLPPHHHTPFLFIFNKIKWRGIYFLILFILLILFIYLFFNFFLLLFIFIFYYF